MSNLTYRHGSEAKNEVKVVTLTAVNDNLILHEAIELTQPGAIIVVEG